MTEALKRISEMETRLTECEAATAALTEQIEHMEALKEPMTALFRYYGSEDWYSDCEAELPEGMPAGVLSQDAVYDAITDIRDAAFRMLELATDILKNRI